MSLDLVSKRVLLFGADGFTGSHLSKYLTLKGFEVVGAKSDITKVDELKLEILKQRAQFIINLAAISFVGHPKKLDFFDVNVLGAINILDCLMEFEMTPKKVILVSSATVYGNQPTNLLDESLCPNPLNYYGVSKLAMENMAKNYFEKLNILISRPFNYTGVGQSEDFLIPKIVKHFREKKDVIELGNLDVSREFNDISFVCEAYFRMLISSKNSEIVNICSNRAIRLLDIIDIMREITNHNIKVEVNPKFVRKDEIKRLTGSPKKLFELVGEIEQIDFKKTLEHMYEA